MRNKLALAALAALLVLPASGLAQTFQLPRNPQVLRNPSVVANLPPLTPQQLDLERLRKVGILRAWGLNVAQTALQPAIVLTPQHPWIDANTNIAVNATGYTPATSLTPTPTTPFGAISFPAAPPTDVFGITLSITGATPQTWYLVECYAADAQVLSIGATYPAQATGEDLGVNTGLSRLRPPSQGRVAALFEPSTAARRTFFITNLHHNQPWVFGGCEITPVRP